MIKTLSEYREAVQNALAPFGLSESEDDILSGYEDYISCAEILGDGDVIAERDDDGDVRVYVRAAKTTSLPSSSPSP
jgi:hypothetical protein